jgi:hypothetical protein
MSVLGHYTLTPCQQRDSLRSIRAIVMPSAACALNSKKEQAKSSWGALFPKMADSPKMRDMFQYKKFCGEA